MKNRLLTLFTICLGLSAHAQLSMNVSSTDELCNGQGDGTVTVDSIMGFFAPIIADANGQTFTFNHLAHEGFDSIVHVDGNDTTSVMSIWAGNNGTNDVYVVSGYMDDTTTIGGTTLNPTSSTATGKDGFIVCFDQNTNTALWSLVLGDGASEAFTQVAAVTSDGQYVYATGLINGTNTLGTYTISGTGYRSFVAKIDLVTGAVDTVITIQSSGIGINYPTDIYTINNKIYAVGGYNFDSITLGGVTYDDDNINFNGTSPVEDLFILCLDQNLNQLWGAVSAGPGSEFARNVVANNINGVTDKIMVNARITGTTAWGTNSITAQGNDVAVAVLDTNGAWLWSAGLNAAGNVENTFGLDVSTDGDRFFVGGVFAGSATINSTTYTSNGTTDGFILGMDTAGAITNFYQFGNALAERGVTAIKYVDNDYLVFTAFIGVGITYADSLYSSMGDADAMICALGLDSTEIYGVQFIESSNGENARFNDITINNGRVLAGGYFLDDASLTQANLLANSNYDGMITNMNMFARVDTSMVFSNLVAGSYPVTIMDSNGNTITDTAIVNSPAPIAISGVVGGASSAVANDGFINLTVTGGNLPYSFFWSNTQTTQNLSGLSYGPYMVTVVDTNGCQATDSFYVDSVFVAPPMQASAVITNEICFGDSNGGIDLTVQYGYPAYSFAWSNGDTTEDLTNIPQGTYFVTITDDSANVLIDTFTVGGNPQIVISAVVTNTTSSTANDGAIDVTVSGGTAPYTYVWSNTETTEDISNLPVGSYTITVTDAAGCSETGTYAIDSVGPTGLPFVVSFTTVNESCFGSNDGAVMLSVGGGTTPYFYTWNTGATTQNLTGVPAGTYYFTVTDNDTSSYSDSAIILGNPQIMISGVMTPPSSGTSNDGALDVTVSGGTAPYSYLWSNSQTTEDISGLGIGSYTITVTDSIGCSANKTFAVDTIPALILVSLSSDVTCLETNNGTIDLTIIGGVAPFTISWSNGASTEDLFGLAAGAYTVTVTDSFGQVEVLTDSVGSNPMYPNPVAGPITGSASVQSWISYTYTVPLSNGSSFLWAAEGGSVNNTASNAASILWNAGPSGTLYVTETDANGCVGQDSLAVTIIYLGVNEAHENTIQVYPNPSNGFLTINLPEAFNTAQLSVFTLGGQMVQQQRIQGLNTLISLNGVARGTYIMQFENDGIILHHKVVIQ